VSIQFSSIRPHFALYVLLHWLALFVYRIFSFYGWTTGREVRLPFVRACSTARKSLAQKTMKWMNVGWGPEERTEALWSHGLLTKYLHASLETDVHDQYADLTTIYRVHGPKMAPFIVRLITSPNINRFSKFFHCQNQETICNKTVTRDPTTPQICRYTTSWNVRWRTQAGYATNGLRD